MMGAPDSRGRRLLFPRALPRLSPLVPGPSQDHEKKRKIAVKCLELEEMLEKQGHSQAEIETKVTSFRSLLLRQLTSVNNNKVQVESQPEEETHETQENGKSDGSEENRGKKKSQKRKKKRRKESRGRKKKKERRRRVSSPTYSDYEPDNPALRNKRRPPVLSGEVGATPGQELSQYTQADNQSQRKERKKRKRGRSGTRSSSRSRSRSGSSKRKSRSCESKKKKKKKRRKVCPTAEDFGREDGDGGEVEGEQNRGTTANQQSIDDGLEGREEEPTLDENFLQSQSAQSFRESNDFDQTEGTIVFSKVEDIPTMAENPKFINISRTESTMVSSNENCNGNYTKLKFEMKTPANSSAAKRNQQVNKTSSTFAELSNRLGPTVSLNNRRVGPASHKNGGAEGRDENCKKNGDCKAVENCVEAGTAGEGGGGGGIQSANTVAEDMEIDENEDQEVEEIVEEEEEEVIYLKTSRSRTKSRSYSRSRSRSYSSSRSRSRSYSYSSSYSRSRSRSYSSSRSRSRSYSYSSYSSRSRSRSRSPSIVRRRGSPSFLDKRRITSARKRPIPYHRPTPSPEPSDSESWQSSRSNSPI